MLTASLVVAQQRTFTITGSVADSSNGEGVPYVNILVAGTSIGTVADVNGYFILRGVPTHNVKLRISAVGYTTKEVAVEYAGGKSVTLHLQIRESPRALPGVEVTGHILNGAANIAGGTVISAGQLKNSVGIFKNDVVQYVTQLPGVVTVSGISSQYYVRGGGPDENLVMIDGMQIYNLSHAFGLFSFVDPMIVKAADFSVGGFQAQYGGRLSSVFDIKTIDGNRKNYQAKGTLDLLSSDIMLTGPLFPGGNSSFVAFYRRPLFQNALQKFYSLGLPFDFYDGFAKATTDLSGVGHIAAEFLTSADRIQEQDPSQPDFRWVNNSAAVSGGYILGDQFDMEFSLSYSAYRAEQIPRQSQYLGYQLDEIQTPSFYCAVTSYTSSRNRLDIGMRFDFPTYNYTFTDRYGAVIEQNVSQIEPDAWAEYTFNPHGKFSFDLGLRTDLERAFQYVAGATGGYLAEPRLTASYKVSPSFTVYADYGIYHQRLMDLNDENLVFTPFDVMAPLPDSAGDEESSQYVLGCKFTPGNLLTARVEVYYKDMSNLAAVNLNKVYNWESDFLFGKGKAYGVDAGLRYDAGRSLYVQASYSYSYTNRTFGASTYFPRYDLRNQVNLSSGFQPLRNLWLRGRVKLTSGLPYTPVEGYFGVVQFNPSNLPGYTGQPVYPQALFGALNSARLPGYESLDLSASYDLYLGWAHLNLQATVTNVLDRKNVFYINNVTGAVVYQLPTIYNLSLGWDI